MEGRYQLKVRDVIFMAGILGEAVWAVKPAYTALFKAGNASSKLSPL